MTYLILIFLFTISLNAQSNFLLLLDGGVVYDTEAQTYFDAAGDGLSTTRKDTINQFVLMLKDSLSLTNLTDMFDRIWLLANTDTVSALNSLVYPDSTDAQTFHAIQFNVDRGFTGDGTNDYINTMYAFSTNKVILEQNSTSMGCYIRGDITETKYDMGTKNSADKYCHLLSKYSGGSAYGVHTAEVAGVAGASASTGLFTVSRTASNVMKLFRNSTELDEDATASNTLDSQNIYIATINNVDGTIALPSTRQYAFAFIGKGLTNAEVSKLFNIVEWYLDAIGAGVI